MKVLVLGYRKKLCKELLAQNIPYVLWTTEKTSHQAPLGNIVAPMSYDKHELQHALEQQSTINFFSHVIASIEESVYPASLLRRLVGARIYEHTKVLECRDKFLMKKYLKHFEIPMTPFIDGETDFSAQQIIDELDFPVVVKNKQQSGGKGLVFAQSINELKNHMSPHNIYEKMIRGEEGSVESFIKNGKIVFTNITRYRQIKHANMVPGSYSPQLEDIIYSLNQKTISALNIQWGMTHLEFYHTEQGIVFGEIALRPPGGYIMDLISTSYGFNSWQAFVAIELGQKFNFPQYNKQFCGVNILHPGAGKILSIDGNDLIKNQPWVEKFKLKDVVGQNIPKRDSVRNEVGHIIYTAESSEQLEERYQYLINNLKFTIEN
ncbi:MAG: ATP-grasp domain-containing protein [Bdellovibrionales bacterium]|nr:ATP-grasp domain-containing protein [Bdellovibrionales bacterium]